MFSHTLPTSQTRIYGEHLKEHTCWYWEITDLLPRLNKRFPVWHIPVVVLHYQSTVSGSITGGLQVMPKVQIYRRNGCTTEKWKIKTAVNEMLVMVGNFTQSTVVFLTYGEIWPAICCLVVLYVIWHSVVCDMTVGIPMMFSICSKQPFGIWTTFCK